jgi:hypothetical protein
VERENEEEREGIRKGLERIMRSKYIVCRH